MLSTGLLKAHEVCKRQRGPPHSFMVQHKLPAIAISRVQLLQHPPPCPGPSHTERNLSSLSFSLRNLLATCSSSLRGWKGQTPALSHVHRGLAWHRATLVTGEVALLAGAQNCFL